MFFINEHLRTSLTRSTDLAAPAAAQSTVLTTAQLVALATDLAALQVLNPTTAQTASAADLAVFNSSKLTFSPTHHRLISITHAGLIAWFGARGSERVNLGLA